MTTHGYRADFIDNAPDFFLRRRIGLLVARENVAGLEVDFPDPDMAGAWVRKTILHGDPLPEGAIVGLPLDSLEAVRDAIDARLGRRYDEALVAELRATLDHERTLVATLLDRYAAHLPISAVGELLRTATRRTEVRS
jgi:hypothetical protein